MFSDLLLAAVFRSLKYPARPIRVVVPNIRSAVESLAEYDSHSTLKWIGDTRRADVIGNGWSLELVAGDADKLRSRLRVRPAVFIPIDPEMLAARTAFPSSCHESFVA